MNVFCLVLTSQGQSQDQVARLQAFAESLLRFTPKVSVRASRGEGPNAVFMEVSHWFQKEGAVFQKVLHSLQLRILALASKHALDVRFGMASSATMAYLRARGWTDTGSQPSGALTSGYPLEALADCLDPFALLNPTNALIVHQQIADLIQRLSRLGIRTLYEFLRLPSSGLSSRFGREIFQLHERLRGSLPMDPPWPKFVPVEKPEEQEWLADGGMPISHALSEHLGFSLKRLCDQLFARLRGRGERLGLLKVTLECESVEGEAGKKLRTREIELGFALPQGSSQGMGPLLREKLEAEFRREPLPGPVAGLKVTAEETLPSVHAQKDLFKEGYEEQRERFEGGMNRLLQRMGGKHVFQARREARHFPEAAWKKEKIAVHAGTSRKIIPLTTRPLEAPRPTRILGAPVALACRGNTLSSAEPGGGIWQIRSIEGPERLSPEWWAGFRAGRDYFRVSTVQGEKLWVFREHARPAAGGETPDTQYFLHGFFD